jgi:hypothetical protein
MNIYIVNDIINNAHNDMSILILCANKTNCKYVNLYINGIKNITGEPFFSSAISQFQNCMILHIKKRLPVITMLDQNHFHFDGFYGACIGGHLDLVKWIMDKETPALGLGLKGAESYGQKHIVSFIENRIATH